MNKEHVIPKSLGGNASTRIFVDKRINEKFGSEIDGKIEKDFMVSFGRRDADTRGHSNKKPTPEWRNAVQWNPTQPIGTGKGPYTLRFPKGNTNVFDPRTQSQLPHRVFNEGGFITWDMKIDHIARFKFTLKTLLGVGWKFFREELIESIDVNVVRNILTSNLRLVEGTGDGGINFTDGFIDKTENGRKIVKRLETAIVRKHKTTILIRQENNKLNWSISCVGYFVGSVWIPASKILLLGEVSDGNGLLLTFGREAYEVDLIPRHLLEA